MSSQKYESGKLNSILESLVQRKKSGILSLKTQVSHWQNQRSCILIWKEGKLTYGELNASKIPTNKEVCYYLGRNLKPSVVDVALNVALEKIKNPNSVRELMDLLVAMKVFTWQDVETFISKKLVLILEQFSTNPGLAKWQSNEEFDLSYGVEGHGLSLLEIQREVARRQQKWQQYAPTVPSIDVVPKIVAGKIPSISDPEVKKHLISSADGRNSLLDIADKMGKDPLKVAKSYFGWAKEGWVNFNTTSTAIESDSIDNVKAKIENLQKQIQSNKNSVGQAGAAVDSSNLPIVLSVDDSAIIQTSIKRALQEQYRVLLAGKTADALKMLDQHPVQLMLLDLTMPDMDGLEFCKLVRKMDKFRELPIIMVTARDGLVNKMKGQIAGSSKYLTKPFQPEQLREVVAEYIQ